MNCVNALTGAKIRPVYTVQLSASIRPLCIFNFGENKRIPRIRFDCEESEDLMQTANILVY